MNMIRVRLAEPGDARVLLDLMIQHADQHGESDQLTISVERLAELLTSPDVAAFLAISGRRTVGFAFTVRALNIWNGSVIVGLVDFYVLRGGNIRGVGKRLMLAIARYALDEKAEIRWEVHPDNQLAQALYNRLGADLRTAVLAAWPANTYAATLRAETARQTQATTRPIHQR